MTDQRVWDFSLQRHTYRLLQGDEQGKLVELATPPCSEHGTEGAIVAGTATASEGPLYHRACCSQQQNPRRCSTVCNWRNLSTSACCRNEKPVERDDRPSPRLLRRRNRSPVERHFSNTRTTGGACGCFNTSVTAELPNPTPDSQQHWHRSDVEKIFWLYHEALRSRIDSSIEFFRSQLGSLQFAVNSAEADVSDLAKRIRLLSNSPSPQELRSQNQELTLNIADLSGAAEQPSSFK
jgi:hypothetical protein